MGGFLGPHHSLRWNFGPYFDSRSANSELNMITRQNLSYLVGSTADHMYGNSNGNGLGGVPSAIADQLEAEFDDGLSVGISSPAAEFTGFIAAFVQSETIASAGIAYVIDTPQHGSTMRQQRN